MLLIYNGNYLSDHFVYGNFHCMASNRNKVKINLCYFLENLVCWVCLGLTSFLKIRGHIATVPTCSSGTLTNVLPHRDAMPQTQDMTPHPVTVYGHRANLSLCYPLMCPQNFA